MNPIWLPFTVYSDCIAYVCGFSIKVLCLLIAVPQGHLDYVSSIHIGFLALLPMSPECNHTTVVTVAQCEPIAQTLCDLVCCGCRVVCVEEHITSIVEYDLVLCITTLVAPCLNMCVCDGRHQHNMNYYVNEWVLPYSECMLVHYHFS